MAPSCGADAHGQRKHHPSARAHALTARAALPHHTPHMPAPTSACSCGITWVTCRPATVNANSMLPRRTPQQRSCGQARGVTTATSPRCWGTMAWQSAMQSRLLLENTYHRPAACGVRRRLTLFEAAVQRALRRSEIMPVETWLEPASDADGGIDDLVGCPFNSRPLHSPTACNCGDGRLRTARRAPRPQPVPRAAAPWSAAPLSLLTQTAMRSCVAAAGKHPRACVERGGSRNRRAYTCRGRSELADAQARACTPCCRRCRCLIIKGWRRPDLLRGLPRGVPPTVCRLW
jgi:hypothetical protein